MREGWEGLRSMTVSGKKLGFWFKIPEMILGRGLWGLFPGLAPALLWQRPRLRPCPPLILVLCFGILPFNSSVEHTADRLFKKERSSLFTSIPSKYVFVPKAIAEV